MDKEQVLNKANEFLAEKNFNEAKNVLLEYLDVAKDDDSIEIQKTLGLCNVNIENMSEAL